MGYLFNDYLKERHKRGERFVSITAKAADALAWPPPSGPINSCKELIIALKLRNALAFHGDGTTSNAHTLWGAYLAALARRLGRPYD